MKCSRDDAKMFGLGEPAGELIGLNEVAVITQCPSGPVALHRAAPYVQVQIGSLLFA